MQDLVQRPRGLLWHHRSPPGYHRFIHSSLPRGEKAREIVPWGRGGQAGSMLGRSLLGVGRVLLPFSDRPGETRAVEEDGVGKGQEAFVCAYVCVHACVHTCVHQLAGG